MPMIGATRGDGPSSKKPFCSTSIAASTRVSGFSQIVERG